MRNMGDEFLVHHGIKGGNSYEDLGTAAGEHSRSIYKMKPGQNVKAQGVSNPDYYKRRRK